jgi:hypothetical protein
MIGSLTSFYNKIYNKIYETNTYTKLLTEDDFIRLLSTGDRVTIENHEESKIIKFDDIRIFLNNNTDPTTFFKYSFHQLASNDIILSLDENRNSVSIFGEVMMGPFPIVKDPSRLNGFRYRLSENYPSRPISIKLIREDVLSMIENGFQLTANDYSLATIILYNSIPIKEKLNIILLLSHCDLLIEIKRSIISYLIMEYKFLYWPLWNI